jgi:signal transduction histidine kinase
MRIGPETFTAFTQDANIAAATTDARVPRAVLAVILISIALLAINASLLVLNTAETMDSNAQYARSYEIKRALSSFQEVITTAESGQRGYLLTGQREYLDPYYRAMRSWRTELDRLRNLTAEYPRRQADIAELEQLTAAAVSRLEQTIESSREPGPQGDADVAGTDRATAVMDRVRAIVDRMMNEEDQRIEALGNEVVKDMWVTVAVALLTTVVTAAVLIGLNKLLARYSGARARADRALLEANQQLNSLVEQRTAELTELSQHLIRVSEEEKAKLARELHDTLGSNLTAINMDLNWILRRMPEGGRELRERLQRALQMLTDTVELKHQVIEGLRPSQLDNLGLSYAMQSHCAEFTRRTGLPCEVDVVEDFDDLDPACSIAFYRIAQEALTNITKHAQASQVRISLKREPGGIRLCVIDDGVGIADDAQAKPKSHGVIGMRERMRQIGGQVVVKRHPSGKGTVVEAFIPSGTMPTMKASPNVGDVLHKVG